MVTDQRRYDGESLGRVAALATHYIRVQFILDKQSLALSQR
jgi:hypothetical protein